MKRLLYLFLSLCLVAAAPIHALAAAPVANFSATPTTSCAPLIVQFTDLSTNTPTSWSWNLGNGTTSTLQNPSTTYTTAGTYTVSLTVTNASGTDTKTVTGFITVTAAPSVSFVASDTLPGCGSKTVTFTNNTTTNSTGAATYYWDFGDGYTSTSQNPPAHTYTTVGTYSVSLLVTNSAGCTKSLVKTAYISVVPKPIASFTASNTNNCSVPVTTSFSNGSTGASTYQWDFGDGGTSTATNPTHTYNTAGSYNVRLIATSALGCRDTVTQSSLVNIGSLTAGFTTSVSTTCTNNAVAFTNTTSPGGGGSMWYFGDGMTSTAVNPSHAYTAAGTYTVKLVVAYSNCSDSTTHTITVAAGPSGAFTATPVVGCSTPLSVTFTNSTTGATSYNWDFGDGSTSTTNSSSFTHSYTSAGTYSVRLISTSSNGCKDTVTKTAYVNIQASTATLNTNPYIGCAPATASFTPTINSLVPVSSYSWNFGDGNTSTAGPNITHTYTVAGTYTVTATFTTSTGCVFTATQNVVASSKITPSFTASPLTVCYKSPISFTNTTSGTATYTWLFGDGTTSTATSPSHVYGVPATYTVTLITNNNGCMDTLVKANYITINPPKAGFTFLHDCANRKQITFANISIGATSYSWDFGDGATSTAANPVHIYSAYGAPPNYTYNVRLVATSSVTGCTDTFSFDVFVFPLIVSFSTPDTAICRGGTVSMSAYNLAYYGSGFYTYGDGSATTTSSTHRYTASGTYSVKYKLYDYLGCADSLVKTAYIKVHAPTASFTNTPGSGCLQLTSAFTDASAATPGSSITGRYWDFGDGTTSTATNPTHTYTVAGNYTVKLVVTESGGCTDTFVKTNAVTVFHPTAAFTTPTPGTCVGRINTFTNTSSGYAPLSYAWDFGDGSTATSASPSHAYASTGTYTVRLIVTDGSGCKDTLTRTNYISATSVTAGFTMSDSTAPCPPFTVSFTNTSVGASAGYLWRFGNGGTSNIANPSAAYTTPGTFTVKLIATNSSGCQDSATRNIVVGTGPVGTFTYTPTTGCVPVLISFSATASGATSLTYDFGNGATQTTTSTAVSYTYTQPGVFHPVLILSNTNGCNTYITGADSIVAIKANAGFKAVPNTGCVGTTVQFTDTTSAVGTTINGRAWAFGDGGTSTATNPSHTYTTAGTYSVRLIVNTPAGCLDTTYRTVVINALPTINGGGNKSICTGGSAILTASGASTYAWSPSTGLSATTGATVTASPTASITYTVTGTSAAGCTNTDTVRVTVNPVPAVTVNAPAPICNGTSATLTASGASSYSWSPATGLSATTGSSVTTSPASTTTYTVTGTSNGCSASATTTLTVNPVPNVTLTGGTTICAGASATLTAGGATTYSWSPSTGLSATTGASVTATPTTTTTYTVTGTSNGCSNTATATVTVTPIPVVSVSGTNAICSGLSTTLTASGATTYSWSPATGLSATTGNSVTASPTTTTTYTVTGTTSGCTATATKTLTVNPLPAVNSGGPKTICAGASTTLTATGAVTYSWSPATGLSTTTGASVTASPTATTLYTVTGTDGNGCIKTDTARVTVNPLPVVSAGPAQFICPGGSATLTATGASSYVWSPAAGLSSTTSASVTASPTATTTYKVVGTSAAGCRDSATVTVTINSTPTVTVSGTLAICAGGNTTLTASGATSYSWTPSTGLSATTGATVTASPAATTTYTVTGTSGIGCTASTTVTVTVNALPTVNAGVDTAVCAGGSVGLTASGANTYSWSPATGLSATTGASVTATPTATTSYIVTGTNANGCVNKDTVVVTVKAPPTISAGANTSICPGGSATLTGTGGVSYTWSPSTGLSATTGSSVTASPTATTTYTLTGTGANGCVNTASVQVAVNSTPTVTISGNNAICSGANTTLTASGANTYSWSPATGLSAATGSSVTASPTTTTTYTVTGTSGVGCTGTAQFTLTVNPLPAIAVSGTTTICTGLSTSLTASGASTYSWSPATGLSATTGATVTASPTATTIYTVTGTSAAGCVNTTNVTVTVNAKPTVTVSPTATAICPGGSTGLTASGANTYSWSPATGLSAATGASVTASPAATTTYTVTGTNSNGCINTATATVSVNATPTVAVSGNNSICAGGSTSLTASGANSYTWSPATGLSATTGATVTASPSTTTTYTITGTSGVGCTGTTTVTVTVAPLPVVSISGTTTICNGASTSLTASGANTYSWSPAGGLSSASGATVSASPSVTTTYTVTGTSGAGCIGNTNVTVTVNALPTVSAGANASICPGQSTTLNATGASSYTWSPSGTLTASTGASVVATPSSTTTYTVTGTGANGCTNTANVTVTVNPQPAVVISGNTSVCSGASTILTASGAAAYTWSPAAGLSSTTAPSVIVSISSTATYKVVGTSGAGCVDSATVTVTIHPRPVVTVTADTTVCLKVPVQLLASGAGTYVWSPAAGLSCATCNNPVATPAATTTYMVRGTDGFGCTDSARTTVTVLPIPNIVASADASICKTTSTQLSVTGGLSYLWTPTAGLSCTTCNNPVASPLTTTAYVVTGTGANGCTASDTVTVNIYAQPPVNAGPDQTICLGQSAQLQASGAVNYVWTPSGTLSCNTCANPLSTPAETTTYTVVGTDIHGCNDSDAVTISVIQRGAIKAGDSSAICEGGSVKLYAEGGDNYLWYPAATLSCSACTAPVATPKASTTYYVVIKQGQCFQDTLSVPVTVHPLPLVNAGTDQSIILGSTAQLHVTGTNISTYSWTPGDFLSCTNCPDPVAAPERDITYTVVVRSDFGCEAQDDVTVHVRCDGSQLWMPNTFTPNADGHNDFFYPHGKGISEVTKMRIYDRWGESIWERNNWPVNDKNNGWDGTYKGVPLKPDVYVWIIEAKCTNGEMLQLKGDITLIR